MKPAIQKIAKGLLTLLLVPMLLVAPALAELTTSGDVVPFDPHEWG